MTPSAFATRLAALVRYWAHIAEELEDSDGGAIMVDEAMSQAALDAWKDLSGAGLAKGELPDFVGAAAGSLGFPGQGFLDGAKLAAAISPAGLFYEWLKAANLASDEIVAGITTLRKTKLGFKEGAAAGAFLVLLLFLALR